MAKSIIGTAATVLGVYQALYGKAPSYALYTNYLSEAGSTTASKLAFTNALAEGFSSYSSASLASLVLSNLGITATTVTASDLLLIIASSAVCTWRSLSESSALVASSSSRMRGRLTSALAMAILCF